MPPAVNTEASVDSRLRKMLTRVLEKSAGDGIRIVRFYPQGESGLKGVFLQRSNCLVFELNWEKNDLSYKMVPLETAKKLLDDVEAESLSRIAILPSSQSSRIRTDAADKCLKGVRCGDACIAASDTCRLQGAQVATPREMAEIKKTAKSRDQKTIRELQKEARDRGVYRANHMSKSELNQALDVLDKDPASQERLRKTLTKHQVARRERDTYLTDASRSVPGDPFTNWSQLQKITRMLGGASPQIAALTVGAFLVNEGVSQYKKAQDHYREGFQESARMAVQQARRIPVDDVDADNIMFTVDGFSQAPSSQWRDIKSHLAPLENDAEDEWLVKNNHVIPLESADFDVPLSQHPKRDEAGNYNPEYLIDYAKGQFGKYLTNAKRGRNQAAVDLASQLYAYGSAYPDKPLNILAHGAGGNVTNEALEILERMRPPDGNGKKGSDISSRINVVMMGTPDFGITKPENNERGRAAATKRSTQNISTVTSNHDPFSILPAYRPKWISTVKGGEIEDYLGDPEVRRHIRESFGYYDSSLQGRKTKKQEAAAEPKPRATRSRAKPVDDGSEEEAPKPRASTKSKATKSKPENPSYGTSTRQSLRVAEEDLSESADPQPKPRKSSSKEKPEGDQE